MAGESAIPESDADRGLIRELLHLAVDVGGTQGVVADILGIDRSTLCKYLGGGRTLGWHIALAALKRVVRRNPEAAARVVQIVAERALDLRGTWVPDVDPVDLDWSKEAADVVEAAGEATKAARSGTPAQKAAAARTWVTETVEAASVLARGDA